MNNYMMDVMTSCSEQMMSTLIYDDGREPLLNPETSLSEAKYRMIPGGPKREDGEIFQTL